MARFMEMSEENHASNIRWNFFATSHGKGVVDRVGGVLMRRAWNKVKARQVVIRNVAEFTDAVKDGGIICNFFYRVSKRGATCSWLGILCQYDASI